MLIINLKTCFFCSLFCFYFSIYLSLCEQKVVETVQFLIKYLLIFNFRNLELSKRKSKEKDLIIQRLELEKLGLNQKIDKLQSQVNVGYYYQIFELVTKIRYF